jgi:AcrR family transcriptional regulator
MRTLFSRVANYQSVAELEGAMFLTEGSRMDERRQQIVATAYDLLQSEGLEGLTIRSVLARTGLARRAFYDRFATKDDLVLAVFEQTLTDAAAAFGDLVADCGDPVEGLQRIVTQIVLGHSLDGQARDGRRAAALAREHLRLAEARPADLNRAIAPLVGVIRARLVAAMDTGAVRAADPDRLALLVYNLVSNTTHGRLIAEDEGTQDLAERQVLSEEIWEFCRRAIIAW